MLRLKTLILLQIIQIRLFDCLIVKCKNIIKFAIDKKCIETA